MVGGECFKIPAQYGYAITWVSELSVSPQAPVDAATHQLPWAGFGLRQPHWLIQKRNVEKSRIVDDLEKN